MNLLRGLLRSLFGVPRVRRSPFTSPIQLRQVSAQGTSVWRRGIDVAHHGPPLAFVNDRIELQLFFETVQRRVEGNRTIRARQIPSPTSHDRLVPGGVEIPEVGIGTVPHLAGVRKTVAMQPGALPDGEHDVWLLFEQTTKDAPSWQIAGVVPLRVLVGAALVRQVPTATIHFGGDLLHATLPDGYVAPFTGHAHHPERSTVVIVRGSRKLQLRVHHVQGEATRGVELSQSAARGAQSVHAAAPDILGPITHLGNGVFEAEPDRIAALEPGVHDVAIGWYRADEMIAVSEHRLLVTPARPIPPWGTTDFPHPWVPLLERVLGWIQRNPDEAAAAAIVQGAFEALHASCYFYHPGGMKYFEDAQLDIGTWLTQFLDVESPRRSLDCSGANAVLHACLALVGTSSTLRSFYSADSRTDGYLNVTRLHAFGHAPGVYVTDGLLSAHSVVVLGSDPCVVADVCFRLDQSASQSPPFDFSTSGGLPRSEYLRRLCIEPATDPTWDIREGFWPTEADVEVRLVAPPSTTVPVDILGLFPPGLLLLARDFSEGGRQVLQVEISADGYDGNYGDLTLTFIRPVVARDIELLRRSRSDVTTLTDRAFVLQLAGRHPTYDQAFVSAGIGHLGLRASWSAGSGPAWMADLEHETMPRSVIERIVQRASNGRDG